MARYANTRALLIVPQPRGRIHTKAVLVLALTSGARMPRSWSASLILNRDIRTQKLGNSFFSCETNTDITSKRQGSSLWQATHTVQTEPTGAESQDVYWAPYREVPQRPVLAGGAQGGSLPTHVGPVPGLPVSHDCVSGQRIKAQESPINRTAPSGMCWLARRVWPPHDAGR
jgi:hypothetical protein